MKFIKLLILGAAISAPMSGVIYADGGKINSLQQIMLFRSFVQDPAFVV